MMFGSLVGREHPKLTPQPIPNPIPNSMPNSGAHHQPMLPSLALQGRNKSHSGSCRIGLTTLNTQGPEAMPTRPYFKAQQTSMGRRIKDDSHIYGPEMIAQNSI